MSRRRLLIGLLVAVLAVATGVAVLVGSTRADTSAFLTRDGERFMLDGRPFAAAGANNYRPMFLDPDVVDDIMRTAAEHHFGVMRVWAFSEVGLADGTDSVDAQNTTTYFHYWDGRQPAFNDQGLKRLDYVVASAKKFGLKLVLPFVNNWGPFGGMDQYVRWAKAEHHDDFYTNAQIRQWYKDWVAHLLNRVNTVTGVSYKDEPAIGIWELANEARCVGDTYYPRSDHCTHETLTAWSREMAAYVKSIDHHHLLGFGDEGFMCGEGSYWTYDCSTGQDARAIAMIPEIDMVGLHLYPDHWGTDVAWATDYIQRHLALAHEVGKPVFMGEYGWRGSDARNAVFHTWLSAFAAGGGDIALYWWMQPKSEYNTPPNSDGFTAYCPSAVCTQVGDESLAMLTGRSDFPPVADTDVLLISHGSVDVLANDISLSSTLDPSSVDLDPTADGIQRGLTVAGGALTATDGTVAFAPTPGGLTAPVTISYTVADAAGRRSDPTKIIVTP